MANFNFRIRTITSGVDLKSLDDLEQFKNVLDFLAKAKSKFEADGYEVQTIRICTPNLFEIKGCESGLNTQNLTKIQALDELCQSYQAMCAIGDPFPTDTYQSKNISYILDLIQNTKSVSFHTNIASEENGIHENSVKLAADICHALSNNSEGGEANFRFTAAANCSAGIPYFPVAYHNGANSFGIGLENGTLFQNAIRSSFKKDLRSSLKDHLIDASTPIIRISEELAKVHQISFNGIDISTAPGLDSSIGKAIEMISGVPFGDAATLHACSIITDVLKNLPFKTCGYSGLMLPVIEDKVLAQRASESKYSIKELLLFSAVCGIGLDVVPIPGDTSPSVIARLYRDMASLSLKYNSKMLSARLFPIPGKASGEWARFENPYLTDCKVMSLS